MSFCPLNRTTAPQMLRFFDVCFKRGVTDACSLGDDYAVREFIDLHKTDWTFGVLGEPNDFDWQMFRFSMYRWARENRLTSFAENYIYKIRTKGYLWTLLPLCMRFYLMGMEEWLEYPNPAAVEVFKGANMVHWAPRPFGQKKITRPDWFVYIQEFAVEHRRLPEEYQVMSPLMMEDFSRAVYDLSRRLYKSKSEKINIKAYFHEDVQA